jgi:hypothetical protein
VQCRLPVECLKSLREQRGVLRSATRHSTNSVGTQATRVDGSATREAILHDHQKRVPKRFGATSIAPSAWSILRKWVLPMRPPPETSMIFASGVALRISVVGHDAFLLRHDDVGDDEIRLLPAEHNHAALAVVGRQHLVAGLLKDLDDGLDARSWWRDRRHAQQPRRRLGKGRPQQRSLLSNTSSSDGAPSLRLQRLFIRQMHR